MLKDASLLLLLLPHPARLPPPPVSFRQPWQPCDLLALLHALHNSKRNRNLTICERVAAAAPAPAPATAPAAAPTPMSNSKQWQGPQPQLQLRLQFQF